MSTSQSVSDFKGSIDNFNWTKTNKAHILQNLKKSDGYFTENRGQLNNESVRFYVQGKGIWFLNDSVVFEIFEPVMNNNFKEQLKDTNPLERLINDYPVPIKQKSFVLKLNFEGVNQVIPIGQELLPHKSNFFYGNDSRKWCTNVPNFQEIVYKNLYENIDFKYYSTPKGLKYDFIIHPDGNPNDIRLRYEGAQNLCIDNSGNLKIKSRLSDMIDSNLFIYQNIENNKKVIKGKFKIINSFTYGFELFDDYDKKSDLIIDPLIYSTYVGGIDHDQGHGMTIDLNGSVLVTGMTLSKDFPNTTGALNTSTNGNYDAYVFKLNPTGSSPIYSTYVGGSSWERGHDITIDTKGNVYVTGETYSADFPNTTNAYDNTLNGISDIFAFKLNYNGSLLIYSTFIGGNETDVAYKITIDKNYNAYITGYTESTDFPNTSGAYDNTYNGNRDVFILKLNSKGSSLVFSTYIGGDGLDMGCGITLDSENNVYVTGDAGSNNFPNTTGAFSNKNKGGNDVFLCKLSFDGSSLIYSTYIGGKDHDVSRDISIDSNGITYLVGNTYSKDFPNTTGAYDTTFNGGDLDTFVLKLNLTTSKLLYSTFIGGNELDWCFGIAIDLIGNAYVAGCTHSSNFPNTTDAYDNTYDGGPGDVVVFKLDPTGSSLLYSTYIGGNDFDICHDIEIDFGGNIYLMGETYSIDFPNTTNAFDNTQNGDRDVFVLKFALNPNNFSFVLDLKISKPAIFRTNPIYLYSNASDIENSEQKLTPFFEYRDPNDQVWNNTYFSDPYYNNSRWEVRFTPPKKALLGLYDFRVRYRDTGWLFSNWFYLNDSLTVLNNIPFVENILLSKNKAILGDNISIWINGSDVEDTEENLTIELEYRDPYEQSWNTTYLDNPIYSNDKWKYTFNIPFNASFGYYDFRVRFNDSDKDFSQWLYKNDSLLLLNLKPIVIDIKLSRNYVYRTNFVSLFVNGTDYETPESLLKFYAQYKPEFEDKWVDLNRNYSDSNHRWEIKFITTINSKLGFYDFRVQFIDNESASSGWEYLNNSLEVLNNIPYIDDFYPSKSFVFRTEIIIIYTNASDIEDPENLLRYVVQFKSPFGDWAEIQDEFFNIDHWEINFTPSIDAELGYYDIRVNFTDMDNGYSGWTIIEDAFEVRNNLPIISNLCDNFEVDFHTKDIDLTQYESDIEDSNEDLIWDIDQTTINTTLFLMNIIDVLEDKIQIIPKENISGSDDITLILTDKDNGLAIKSNVTIHVNSVISYYYNVNITVSPNSVDIIHGQSLNVTLIVSNIGNLSDNYTILFESNEFTTQDIQIEKKIVSLNSDDFKNVNVTITIPKDMKVDTYNIIFIARSNFAIDNTTFTINVEAKDIGIKDNTILFVSILIIIIIVIIILISLFLIILKKKSKKREEKMETKTPEEEVISPLQKSVSQPPPQNKLSADTKTQYQPAQQIKKQN